MIKTYNQNRGAERQFSTGYVYNGTATCNWQTEYGWSILDSIRKCICRDSLYLRVRRVYESGKLKRYIDAVRLEDYGKTNSQPIEYGYNLLDYVKDSDYGNLTNVLTPYGAELEDAEVYADYSKRLQGDTISNSASINKYGRHAKAVIFDGVTNKTTLNNLAKSYLSRYCQPQLTMEVKAVDLSVIENVAEMAIGDSIHVVAKPFAVDQYLYLTELRRDIQNADKNTLTLSGHVDKRTLTSQVINATNEIEEIPSEWDLLKAAKKNALAMLLDETQGGYVVFEYNDDKNPSMMTAINICNAKTIEASTKRWRWSEKGLGYMERKSINSAWPNTSTLKAAITYDGHIVADFMDTGSLTAAIITAGILQDRKKQFSLDMETGALTMKSGTFSGKLDAAKGTFSGSLSAATGTFSGSLSAAKGTFTGSLKGASGDFTGKITATSGFIGTAANGWNIKSNAIFNGPAKVSSKKVAGMYVGTDGILNTNGSAYTQITNGQLTTTRGKIGSFNINSDGTLTVGDTMISPLIIGCGEGGKGIVNMVGGQGTSGDEQYGYIQISNSGDPTDCSNGIRIYGNGHVVRYRQNGSVWWDKYLSNIPDS